MQSVLLALAFIIIVVAISLGEKRQWISFASSDVQAIDTSPRQRASYFIKGVAISLVILRLIFSFSNLSERPYNVDEVRGLYRLAGYQESEIVAKYFQGEILNVNQLKTYQRLSPERGWNSAFDALSKNPEHPPLYSILARGVMSIWNDAIAARILAILLGVATLPLAYWLCLELFNSPSAGWVTVALLSISPYQILLGLGLRSYSLWTLAILASGVALLRAVKSGTVMAWFLYSISICIGLYSHLFFIFIIIAQGLYILFTEWQDRGDRIIGGLAASIFGLILFSPWIWITISQLDRIEDNTRWVRGRPSSFISIFRATIENIGNNFVNSWQSYSGQSIVSRFLVLGIALSLYFLIRQNSIRIWGFLILPILVTLAGLAIPDLLQGGGRSLQSRYLVPALLPMTLALSICLANITHRARYIWERLFGSVVLSILILAGVLSGFNITQYPGWDYLEHGSIASPINFKVAPIIRASEEPFILSDSPHNFVLSLSHQIPEKSKLQLFEHAQINKFNEFISLEIISRNHRDLFLYFPSEELKAFVDEQPDFQLSELSENLPFFKIQHQSEN
ncbi:MAG: glycosyltransferase family 39 protein [Phormidium sp. BM_Day4_Bin.17]|nr:glycosyltransferase family 39 protein [Phormidium sp. BM_Day4_Bin.17]UCJ13690.1 MAG: glycosyltransferase family 39 protein [Phormidium sp. PBR-2020]